MALRRLGLRRPTRRRAAFRRARPGAASQPPLVFLRLRAVQTVPGASTVPTSPVPKASKAPKSAKAPAVADTRKPRRTPRETLEFASAVVPPSRTSAPSPMALPPVPAILLETLGPARRKGPSKLPPLPPILLEGDVPWRSASRPAAPSSGVGPTHGVPAEAESRGVGARPQGGFAPTGSSASSVPFVPAPTPGPSGGTDWGRVFPVSTVADVPRPEGSVWMVPRDPQTFLAFWTHSRAALDQWSSVTAPGVWTWRLRGPSETGPVVASGPLPSENGFQFVTVALAGVTHVFEIGVLHPDGGWTLFATSQPVATPPGRRPADPSPSGDPFGGAPPVFPWRAPSSRSTAPDPASASNPSHVPRTVLRGVPASADVSPVPEELLEEVLFGASRSTGSVGSSEQVPGTDSTGTTIRRVRRGPGGAAGAAAPEDLPSADLGADWADDTGSAALAAGPGTGPRPFWFRVNAEVVLHGSTEPDAKVAIAGRPVALRPDGSFTFRFSLPDGDYELPVVAVSAAGDDARAAAVAFRRTTRPTGDVGVHPIDAALRPPVPSTFGPG